VGHGPLCPAVEEERGDLGLRNAYGPDRLGCGPLARLLTSTSGPVPERREQRVVRPSDSVSTGTEPMARMLAAAELRPIA